MANKKQQEDYYNGQLSTAENMKALGRLLIAQATQIESEAKSALELLRATPRRTPKGKSELSDELRIKLLASLTK